MIALVQQIDGHSRTVAGVAGVGGVGGRLHLRVYWM